MNKRLLTLDNLLEFYSTRKRSQHFDASESGEPIVVQVNGTMSFEKDEDSHITDGLTPVRLQACHTDRNLNASSISYSVMKDKMLPTFKNRPILGYIHYVDDQPNFGDHRMHMDGEDIVYDEVAVGIIPETNNASLVYDETEDHYNVIVDGYIFNEYTKASEILQREQECSVSVEISISKMSFDSKTRCLNIEDGFFSGVTILGLNEDGSVVKPGMAGSNIKLKDFSETNNSLFSNIDENNKLVETLERLNTTLSKFNINKDENPTENYGKEDIEVENNEEVKVEEEVTTEETVVETEEVTETESTEEVTETTTENESEDPVEDAPEVVETEAEETVVEEEEVEPEVTEEESETEKYTIEKKYTVDGQEYSLKFELSFNDITYGLYNLIGIYDEMDNDCYMIKNVYEDYFVMQAWCSNAIYGQKYTVDGDNVALDGERYALHEELLTDSELAELENMRSNYSAIQTELNSYKYAEELADKATVFEDEAYSAYLDTEEFKSLMSEETMKQFTKEELTEKADAALGKIVKEKKTFAYKEKEVAPKTTNTFAFAQVERKSNFLDSLLGK